MLNNTLSVFYFRIGKHSVQAALHGRIMCRNAHRQSADQFGDHAVGDDASVVDDHDAIGHGRDFLQNMRGEDDGLLTREALDQVTNAARFSTGIICSPGTRP